jgi:hypothetical protein
MPALIDTSEVVQHDHNALDAEQSQVRGARAGCWHTVMASVRRYRTHRLQRRSSSDRRALRQLGSPMARLAQEQPRLYLLGFFGIPNG